MKNNISCLLRYSTPNLGDETSPITLIILAVIVAVLVPAVIMFYKKIEKDRHKMMRIFVYHSFKTFGTIKNIQYRRYAPKGTVTVIDKKIQIDNRMIYTIDVEFQHKNMIINHRIESLNPIFDGTLAGDNVEVAYIPKYFDCIAGKTTVEDFLGSIGLKEELYDPKRADIHALNLNQYPMVAANCDIKYEMFD